MKYTVIGCIQKYGIEEIQTYVQSINKSGFTGEKLMLVYDVSNEVIEYLQNNGWIVVTSQLGEHVILQRFRDVYALLHQYKTDVVIWTDVKDVVFQNDPTQLAYELLGNHDILALSECIKLKDDPWAVVNSGTSFPMEWEFGMKERISYCAGTIIGRAEALRDLFIEIYRWSKTTANSEQLSDQAAYNVLIQLNHFRRDKVVFVKQEKGLATQLGTVWAKKDQLPILEPTPIFRDGKFYTQNGIEFSIVHQYDRDPIIKEQIKNLYK